MDSLTSLMQSQPETFSRGHILTAAGIGIPSSGMNMFSLTGHDQDANNQPTNIVTLGLWRPPATNDIKAIQGAASSFMIGEWLPQGSNIDVRITPRDKDAKFVFTPDFSGCSLIIDQINADEFRIYHVQGQGTTGNNMHEEYECHAHGLGQITAVHAGDYVTNADNPCAFMFMKYVHDGDSPGWHIYKQRRTGLGIHYAPGKPLTTINNPSFVGLDVIAVNPR